MPVSGNPAGKDTWKVPDKHETKFDLAGSTGILVPAGRTVIGIWCDHANFTDVDVQVFIDGSWLDAKELSGGGGFDPRAQAVTAYAQWYIASDGTNVRIFNNNVGVTNNIIYTYKDS